MQGHPPPGAFAMKAFKAPLAALLCCTMSAPGPLMLAQDATPAGTNTAPSKVTSPSKVRAAYKSTQLKGDERILHALNRLTFGPRPGDVDQVRNTGLDRWFESQLHPETLDETALNTRLAQFPAMQWNTEDLLYRLPSNGEIRQAMNGKGAIPENGTLHAIYENQIFRVQVRKDQKQQTGAAQQPANPAQPAMSSAQPQVSECNLARRQPRCWQQGSRLRWNLHHGEPNRRAGSQPIR